MGQENNHEATKHALEQWCSKPEPLPVRPESAGWVSVSDLEKFVYETRDDSMDWECESDEDIACGINQAMDGLTRLIESKKPNEN